jgi:hypothetical protein
MLVESCRSSAAAAAYHLDTEWDIVGIIPFSPGKTLPWLYNDFIGLSRADQEKKQIIRILEMLTRPSWQGNGSAENFAARS